MMVVVAGVRAGVEMAVMARVTMHLPMADVAKLMLVVIVRVVVSVAAVVIHDALRLQRRASRNAGGVTDGAILVYDPTLAPRA